MPPPSGTLAHVLDLLAPLGPVKARAMFGGWSISLDGLTFALVADDVLYFKVDGETRGTYEALGLGPFVPFPDQPQKTMAYHPPPDAALNDSEEMLAWARPALEVARRAALKKRRPRKSAATAADVRD